MNRKFMAAALEQAELAFNENEVPVGAVVVKDGEIIAVGHNMREKKQSALSHAEIEAIDAACKKLGTWRLDDCELYVTLEPCPMCAGAILNARIKKLVFGAYDINAGSVDSVMNVCNHPYYKKPEIYGGIMEDTCNELLQKFFEKLR